jgi:hypothetical protein
MTWNPELQQLVFSPLVEQAQLRGGIVGQLEAQALPAGALSLGLPKGAGNQTELVVSFERPTAAVRLAVEVMVGLTATVALLLCTTAHPLHNRIANILSSVLLFLKR